MTARPPGAVPQVMPEIAALWLYRFEINIRASAVLGVVGAGGIGTMRRIISGPRAGRPRATKVETLI